MAISQAVAQAILRQKTPDIMGAFERGQETAFKRQERDRQEKISELSGMAIQGSEGAMGDLSDLDATAALKIQEALGVRDKSALERMYIDAKQGLNLLTEGRTQDTLALVRNRLRYQRQMGVFDNSQTENIERLLSEGKDKEALASLSSFVSSIDSLKGGQQGATSRQQEWAQFEAMPESTEQERKKKQEQQLKKKEKKKQQGQQLKKKEKKK